LQWTIIVNEQDCQIKQRRLGAVIMYERICLLFRTKLNHMNCRANICWM